jgi:hypothetical protein
VTLQLGTALAPARRPGPSQLDQLAGDLRLLAPLAVGRAARFEPGDRGGDVGGDRGRAGAGERRAGQRHERVAVDPRAVGGEALGERDGERAVVVGLVGQAEQEVDVGAQAGLDGQASLWSSVNRRRRLPSCSRRTRFSSRRKSMTSSRRELIQPAIQRTRNRAASVPIAATW